MKVFAIIFLFAIVTVAVSSRTHDAIAGAGSTLSDVSLDSTIKSTAEDGNNWTIAGLNDAFEKEHLQAIVKHLEKNLGVHINDNDELEKVLEDALKASHKSVDQFLDDITAGADQELIASA